MKDKKFNLKYKTRFFDDSYLEDTFLNYNILDKEYALEKDNKNEEYWQAEFTEKEIEHIKFVNDTDLADFEIIETD